VTVIEIARRFDKSVMTLLLDRRGNDVHITDDVAQRIRRMARK
jgi:hypothetical protein